MGLNIETFSNVTGGNALYKALAHPLAGEKIEPLIDELARAGPVAIYDPLAQAASFAALYDLSRWEITASFLQRIEELGQALLGRRPEPVTGLPACRATTLFLAAFDAEPLRNQIRHLVPEGMRVVTFDDARLPEEMLTNGRRYLDPLNFATNFAFFRDADGQHTRIESANYWHGHGAASTRLWLRLYGAGGEVLAEWTEALPAAPASFAIDSREVRSRFGLPAFVGSLFMHVIGAAGHDVVKYVIDTYGDRPEVLSSTHDANAWPADRYAGLPAPGEGERVVLWVQNSHPVAIPKGGIGLNLMGSERVSWLDAEIPPFATYPLDVAALLPEAAWPAQLEVRAGRYFVRPRYEVAESKGPTRIAHANVERTDLRPDPRIPELGNLMGKGYILPASILPPERWRSIVLPTPMATCQRELPLATLVFDASGREVLRHGLGRLARSSSVALDLNAILEEADAGLESGYGHVELLYDFGDGGEADGWLHGLFRYQERESGHVAETSFGAHIYNLPITYGAEPQSYIGRPPGLSTRLYLRLGEEPLETLFQLIYPASAPWHPESSTTLLLHDGAGAEVARREVKIPCSGSRLFRYGEVFDARTRARAGAGAYLIVRDTTCRLFGYQGLLEAAGAFSFDHMFGF